MPGLQVCGPGAADSPRHCYRQRRAPWREAGRWRVRAPAGPPMPAAGAQRSRGGPNQPTRPPKPAASQRKAHLVDGRLHLVQHSVRILVNHLQAGRQAPKRQSQRAPPPLVGFRAARAPASCQASPKRRAVNDVQGCPAMPFPPFCYQSVRARRATAAGRHSELQHAYTWPMACRGGTCLSAAVRQVELRQRPAQWTIGLCFSSDGWREHTLHARNHARSGPPMHA